MRPIDADRLCEALIERWNTADKNKEKLIIAVMADIVTPIVASQPTIEPIRKRGMWIDVTKNDGCPLYKCSECEELNIEDYYFCPNCGADMRKELNNG